MGDPVISSVGAVVGPNVGSTDILTVGLSEGR